MKKILGTMTFSDQVNEDWTKAWETTRYLLREINNDVRAQGLSFGVVTLSVAAQVYPDAIKRAEIIDDFGIENIWFPDEQIAELGDEAGFPVITLAPTMAQYAQDNNIYLHGFENTMMGTGHWNENGHLLAAKLMTPGVCGWISP